MRIMIVTDQYPPMVGGVPKVTQRLATDFASRGHVVGVIAPSYGSRDAYRVDANVHLFRFTSFEYPTYVGLRIAMLPILPFRRLLKRFDPDIIHIHSPVVLGNVAQIVAGRTPVVATNHYLPINMGRVLSTNPLIGKPFKAISYTYLVRFCNRCAYVTSPTSTALNLLYEHGLRAPAMPISNGIDLDTYHPGKPDEEVRQRFHLPSDLPLILSANRLSQEKRTDVLIDAAAKLREKAHIVITGSGPLETALRAQVDALGLGHMVSFLGFISDQDLIELYRLSSIFAIPSEADLQSMATMEAMATGLPIVAANAYALPELVHHGINGFLFEQGKSNEMAAHLDTLLSNVALRRSMGAKSLEIIAPHDRTLILDQWESLYHRLSNEHDQARERTLQMRLTRSISRFMPSKQSSRRRRQRESLALDNALHGDD
jgi:glycosyltransferase involved in cell wall biosynthesis